jgi:hypothetical protein
MLISNKILSQFHPQYISVRSILILSPLTPIAIQQVFVLVYNCSIWFPPVMRYTPPKKIPLPATLCLKCHDPPEHWHVKLLSQSSCRVPGTGGTDLVFNKTPKVEPTGVKSRDLGGHGMCQPHPIHHCGNVWGTTSQWQPRISFGTKTWSVTDLWNRSHCGIILCSITIHFEVGYSIMIYPVYVGHYPLSALNFIYTMFWELGSTPVFRWLVIITLTVFLVLCTHYFIPNNIFLIKISSNGWGQTQIFDLKMGIVPPHKMLCTWNYIRQWTMAIILSA